MIWPIGELKKYYKNPIINPFPLKERKFENAGTYNGTAIKKDNKIYLIYRAEQGYQGEYISSIAIAESEDGINFKKHTEPILRPKYKSEKRGCEDPRICKIKDTYYMTYVGWSGKSGHLTLAKSKDLKNWNKKIILKNTKSGAILPEKINGKYYMYFGDSDIYIATSDDLEKWDIQKEPVMKARKNYFDSGIVEPGPCPILTKKGIFMIYNSSDESNNYHVGYAMFDKNNPEKLIARTSKPVLSPVKDWEKYGKVNYVVFVEGLVEQNNKYFLYYGGADKCLGIAMGEKLY